MLAAFHRGEPTSPSLSVAQQRLLHTKCARRGIPQEACAILDKSRARRRGRSRGCQDGSRQEYSNRPRHGGSREGQELSITRVQRPRGTHQPRDLTRSEESRGIVHEPRGWSSRSQVGLNQTGANTTVLVCHLGWWCGSRQVHQKQTPSYSGVARRSLLRLHGT